MLSGRDSGSKKLLLKNVTAAVTSTLGVAADSVRVILEEVADEHYGVAGLPIARIPLAPRRENRCAVKCRAICLRGGTMEDVMRKKLFFVFLMAAICPWRRRAASTPTFSRPPAAMLRITFIGHGSLQFQFNDLMIYVDPDGRLADFAKLPKAGLILVTHQHGDHFDPAAIEITAPGRDRDFRQPRLPAAAGGGARPEERRPRRICRRGHRGGPGLQHRPAKRPTAGHFIRAAKATAMCSLFPACASTWPATRRTSRK